MSTSIRRGGRLLNGLLVLALLLTLAPPLHAAPQVNIKISHALGANQRVLDFRVSPDGSRVVYRVARSAPPDQDNPPPSPADLFSAPATGGAPVQLNQAALQPGDSVTSYQFSPDGSEVIYTRTTSDTILGNIFEIFRTPVAGGSLIPVSGPIAVGARDTRDFKVDVHPATVQFVMGDGSVRTINTTVRHSAVPERISSISDGTSNTFFFGEQVNNLLQFPYEGAARRLNPSLTSGGVVYDFALTPDGTRAIYRADQNLDGAVELFSVPADGSDAGFRISGPLVAGGDVLDFQVNPASTRAVYRADQTTNGVVELYSAPTNGGIVTKLNASLTLGGNVQEFVFSPDGSLVLYLADQFADGFFGLFAAATTGGRGVSTISSGFSGRNVRAYRISPDGDYVYSVETTGSGLGIFRRPFALNAALLEELLVSPVADVSVPDLKFSADGSHLVYLADRFGDGVYEVASVNLVSSDFAQAREGLAPAITLNPQINGPLVPGGNIRAFQVSPDGRRVVYAADQNTAGVVELFSVPIDGGTVDQVNGPLAPGGNVRTGPADFQFSPDGRAVYYLADQETAGVTELFAAFDAPMLSFTQNGYVVAEDGSLATQLAVERSGALVMPASIKVQLTGTPSGGTAKGGSSFQLVPDADFIDNMREVVFATGEISKTFTVAVKNDGIGEPAETFSMQLFEPVQGIIGFLNNVQVTILDTASAPLLDDRTYQVAENRPNGTVLMPARAAPAAAQAITYTILAGNTLFGLVPFRVDSTGALVVNSSAALDFESSAFATMPTPGFTLLVEARSDSGSVDTATWRVNLTNVEEPPLFPAPPARTIAENSPNGTLVGALLAASDPERGPITFTTTSSVFAITPGGQLSVKNSSALDYETTKSFSVPVVVSDRNGLSTGMPVQVGVMDVAEGDPTAPAIDSISPGVAIVGGSGFKLFVYGRNFTADSVVRWNGNNRTTILSSGRLIAYIPPSDIATTKIAAVTVRNPDGKLSNAANFLVKFALVGLAELNIEPAGAQSTVGQTTVFNLAWTHTTEPWRAMNEMDMRLIDGERIPLWVRYQETRDENGNDISTIHLLNADGTPAGSGRFGEAKVIENATVRIDLADASFQGSGADGSNIRVRIPAVFKQPAVQAEPYGIEMYGVDDLGGEQGPNLMGEWTIMNAAVYLPAVQR